MKSVITTVITTGIAALGGGLAVYSDYDDSPGGQVIGVSLVLAAMAFGARGAWRRG